MKTAYWKVNKDGEKGEEESDKEEDTTSEDRGNEVQYLIKWLGFSHLHNTWETGKAIIHSV